MIKKLLKIDNSRILTIIFFYIILIKSLFRLKWNNNRRSKVLDTNEYNFPADGVFFILGSGVSINNLTNENFDFIRDNTSVGINRWVLHEFIPNFYSFEYSDSKDDLATVNLINDFLLSDKLLNKNSQILFNHSAFDRNKGLRYKMKNDYLDKVRVYSTIRLPVWSEKSLFNLLRLILSKFFLRNLPNGLLYGKRASIERMTYLGVKMGFKKIVYLGIDLNNNDYFWEKKEEIIEKYKLQNYSSGQNNKVHNTELKHNNFPVSKIIKTIQRVANKNNEIEFFVGNKESELANFLNIYNWKND
jgi:hypothetical protein